jgi:hypothetical protein
MRKEKKNLQEAKTENKVSEVVTNQNKQMIGKEKKQ